jgi:hypothetical protein
MHPSCPREHLLKQQTSHEHSARRKTAIVTGSTASIGFATTQEVANMVVYLASGQASATSVAAVRVDGGVVRSIV